MAKKTARAKVKKAAKRATTKAGGKKPARKAAKRRTATRLAAEAPAPDLRGDFLRLVSKLGSAEAQRLLDTFVEVETPRRS